MNINLRKTAISLAITSSILASITTYAAIEDQKISRQDRQAMLEQAISEASDEIQDIYAKIKADRSSVSREEKSQLKEYIRENTDLGKRKGTRKMKGIKNLDIENAPSEIQVLLEKAKEDKASLTSDERQVLGEYIKTQREEKKAEKFSQLPENIQEILTKGKNDRSSLTEDDKSTLRTYFKENPDAFPKRGKHKNRR